MLRQMRKTVLTPFPSLAGFLTRGRMSGMTTWLRSPLPSWCSAAVGMFIGQAVWGLCLAAAYAGLGSFFSLIAVPIGILGWLLIWGDSGTPPWAESISLHLVFGLCFYGVIGALIGWRIKVRRDGKAKLMGE